MSSPKKPSPAQATVNAGTNAKAADVYMARMPRDLRHFSRTIMPQEIKLTLSAA